jgi:hypothetical protein
MAEVIGQAQSVAKNVTCHGCGAVVRYYRNDIQRYEGRDISGGPDGREWIVCPGCSKQITLRSW